MDTYFLIGANKLLGRIELELLQSRLCKADGYGFSFGFVMLRGDMGT